MIFEHLFLHTYHNIIREIKFKNHENEWSSNTQAKLSTMKYYRISRPNKKSTFSLYYWLKNREKSEYIISTGRSKKLKSGYYENQVWGALEQAWKGYKIAKNKDEYDKMELYARRVQELQHDLGLEVSSFDNLDMSAISFLWETIRKEDDDANNEEQQVADEEHYQTDYQYEHDRLTDDNAYSEYFKDDFNAGDRFTS
jgi:hypothetical protein